MILRSRAIPAFIFCHRTVLALTAGAMAGFSAHSSAVDILRSSPGAAVHSSSSASSGSAASASQTSTAATAAAAEQAQTAVLAARAQSSLMRATAALHAKQQSEVAAQQAAANATSPSVPSGGLVVHGLVPGTVGIDPADPTTVAIPIPVITNAQGLASITLPAPAAAGSASDITLPGSIKGNTQITVSGTGAVGTVTTGETITTLTGGASTTIAPGSTISLTNGGTITFANGSAGIPTSFNTYSFPGASTAAPSVPGSWSGVGGLSQATYGASGQTTVTIDQNAQQALLTWQSFNIGKNTLLDFDQSAGGTNVGQWVAINKVAANVAPSDILGAIQAPGQVYVINQNGILFSGTSQINVGALVASSLPINDNLVSRGLLNNPDDQFLFTQLNQVAGSNGPTPSFTAPAAPTAGTVVQIDSSGNANTSAASGFDGDVVVQAGAQLTSLANAENVGGKIALIGPNVANDGTITTPNGQAILAAGNQVAFAAHNSSDASLRGLDVYVGSVDAQSGLALNTGLIEAPEADVTMTGKSVDQNGVIDSSTSVALNGRIDLLADYGTRAITPSTGGAPSFDPTLTGTVTFGAGSVSQILPETSSSAKVVGTQLALSSVVNVEGGSIYMAPDSVLLAPGAVATTGALGIAGQSLTSGVNFNAGNWVTASSNDLFYNTTGQIYLDTDAAIDVSGSENVSASVGEDVVAAQLLGSELANSPLQQNGPLRGQTIYVDVRDTGVYDGTPWIGTPLADVSGYVNLIQRTVGELTANGGSVALNAGSSVVMKSGSNVNVSGGWINYQGATVQTTKLISSGQIIDISQATPDQVYQGILGGFVVSSTKYGLNQTYNSNETTAQYDPGYLQGGNGGSLSITAPSMVLSGNLYGNTVTGSAQRTAQTSLSSTYSGASFLPTVLASQGVPTYGTLSLLFDQRIQGNQAASPNITFETDASIAAAGPVAIPDFSVDASGNPEALPVALANNVVLSQDVVNTNGFGNLSITSNEGGSYSSSGALLADGGGKIIVPTGVALDAAPGSQLSFTAANIDIEGSLDSPDGSLSFTTSTFSPYAVNQAAAGGALAVDPDRGTFTLGSGSSLNVAGEVIDDRTGADAPLFYAGGSVIIKGYNVDLADGSAIDASGGLHIAGSGALAYGNGGKIAVSAAEDPMPNTFTVGGTLSFDPAQVSLSAYSGATGGSLTLQAPYVQLGGGSLQNGAASGETLLLNPQFFSQGGFGTFTLVAVGEENGSQTLPTLLVAPNAVIDPLAESYVATLTSSGATLIAENLPDAASRTPVSLNLEAPGVVNASSVITVGNIVMSAGASISTDPQRSGGGVTLAGDNVTVLGRIVAPGGNIVISGSNGSLTGTTSSSPTVDLGPDSLLSSAGAVELTPNNYNLLTGSVLNGGNITVSGNIVAEAGAVLNVSGTSGVLDLPGASGSFSGLVTSGYAPTTVDSNGGTLTLKGGQELFTDATLLGAAGGAGAVGGTLSVSSGRPVESDVLQTPLDVTLEVTQSGPTIPTNYNATGEAVIGDALPTTDSSGHPVAIDGHFAADSFTHGGFDSLNLGSTNGAIQFDGSVTIAARDSLTVGQNGVIYEAPSAASLASAPVVNLSAPYIALGMAFKGPLTPALDVTPFEDSSGLPYAVSPTAATPAGVSGTLNLNASTLLDAGDVSLQQIGNFNVNMAVASSSVGDIRGDGLLDVAGNIALRANQIYPTTETSFTVAAHDVNGQAGTITIAASGNALPELPFSAGGTLNLYASDIVQDGVLRAPIGMINLGSGIAGANPVDLFNDGSFNPTQNLNLGTGSNTSVAAVEPNGQDLTIPYGTILNGISWIDPSGTDITAGGVPGKTVNISGVNVTDQAGSTVDLSGGGDLEAYRFVSGLGGTNDILASSGSFAVIPGYTANYAATSPYNTAVPTIGAANPYSEATTADSGYVNGSLQVGEKVYLTASSGLPAGVYTLLPARYALLPGAFLVTPRSNIVPNNSQALPDGSTLVSGYEFNGLDTAQTGHASYSTFEVDSQAVVESRAEYDISDANTFLAQSAAANNVATPRLPKDAGQLVIEATHTLSIEGSVSSSVPTGGLGSVVDISSPSDIFIGVANADGSAPPTVPASALFLDAASLSNFGADSLLIGGYRTDTSAGTAVTVVTGNLTVDNPGTGNELTGPDIILAANNSITVAAGSTIEQGTRSLSGAAQTLLLGDAATVGSGDGTLVRISSDPNAQIIRQGVDTQADQASLSAPPSLNIGNGATLSGTSLILDSTYATSLSSGATLKASDVSLNSGQISLELQTPAVPPATLGLVLSNTDLQNLQSSVQALSLLSYSSIDIYGSGQIGATSGGKFLDASLALHAGGILAYNEDGGTVTINAQNVAIDDSPGSVVEPGAVPLSTGALILNGATVTLGGGSGQNNFEIEGYGNVAINAAQGVLAMVTSAAPNTDGVTDVNGNVDPSERVIPGSTTLSTAGSLTITTPLLTGATGANLNLNSGSALTVAAPVKTAAATVIGGLGANLSLTGSTVTDSSSIVAHSGSISLDATTGDINLAAGGTLDVSGTAQKFEDLIEYTSGGSIMLDASGGDVNLAAGSTVNVSAQTGGGNAGTLAVTTSDGAAGAFNANGSILGQGGVGGQGGSFSLDVGSLPDLAALEAVLNPIFNPQQSVSVLGGFTQSQQIRVHNGDVEVDGTVATDNFALSADAGVITVASTGRIIANSGLVGTSGAPTATIDVATTSADGAYAGLADAGQNGGSVSLQASGNVDLESGSIVSVAAKNYSDAGEGGSVLLGTTDGRITVGAGSTIDLSVTRTASLGDLSGTLHIRAPQLDASGNVLGTNGTATPVGVAVDPLAGNIIGASSIAVEGFYRQDAATVGNANIDGATGTNYKTDALANATAFMLNAAALQTALVAPNGALANVLYVAPGEEIDNSAGSLVLNNNWDFSTARFGPDNAPGFLTLRAGDNLIFNGSLSDGFTSTGSPYGSPQLSQYVLMPFNPALPANAQSWSYDLSAGADFTAADPLQVIVADMAYDPSTGLPMGPVTGTLELGKLDGAGIARNQQTTNATALYYQVIRTGTGNINITTGGDVQLLNQLATIYTAGVQAPALAAGTFDTPILKPIPATSGLPPNQESPYYPPQYSYAGGNVDIDADGSIEHETTDSFGQVIPDSERQLPDNWLDRRGYVANGAFGVTGNGDVGSTSWWIDFSNFFEGVGALGGGNVSLVAGGDVDNVDAVIPTNMRVTKKTSSGDTAVADQTAVELGGGDLLVRAGNDINAGVYYVEKGEGTLSAGNSIITNATRSPTLGILSGTTTPTFDPTQTWLPTTLFLGKGSFSVAAENSVLLGPVANTFLLPESINNTYYDKTYFSTYAADDSVSVTSLTGDVTLQESATITPSTGTSSLLGSWLTNVDLYSTDPSSPSYYQPWLLINETDVTYFQQTAGGSTGFASSLLPPAIHAVSFSQDLNLEGDLTLSPSPVGTVDLLAAGSINGLQPNGVSTNVDGSNEAFWSSSTINLSDANPAAIPGVFSPYAYQAYLVANGLNGTLAHNAEFTANADFLSNLDQLFAVSGSITGDNAILQTKQQLHADIDGQVLHANDPNPVHLYADAGDISGVGLFSGKPANIVAGQDITDIAFYLQNDNAAQVSVVAAGRDIIAYDPNAPLLTAAQSAGNVLDDGDGPLAGDIQIAGPGTLEVLSGRNLNLGVGPINSDGTGAGLTSIGAAANPTFSPNLVGADIVAGAGIGTVSGGLNSSQLDFGNVTMVDGAVTPVDATTFADSFIGKFLSPVTAPSEAATYLPDLGSLLGLPSGDSNQQVWSAFSQLSSSQQDTYALDVFYLVLRDSGRNHNTGAGTGYTSGYDAIAALFPASQPGDISLTSREIKTENGGNISLFVPDGAVNVGLNVAGTQAADQGILTEDGGNISIFANGDVNVGTSRIFTLRGGNEIIYSTHGNIAAGASSKTVQSASPTRVLIDPQSGSVQTDLAGLATGGGIGVLESVAGIPPADVDLIAPNGIVNAGDAGIRASGNLNIAAVQVLNAANISVGGKSSGVPTASAPNIAGLSAASGAIGAATNSSIDAAQQAQHQELPTQTDLPSVVTVEVLGYGGGDDDN